MWTIRQIFDGDYGCEELPEGVRPKVLVTIVNEAGETREISVEDAWLSEHGLAEGATYHRDHVILASQSPRRKELLGRIVPTFDIIPARGEERSTAVDPREYVRELSMHKAREVMDRILKEDYETVYVIGSDTIVVCKDQIMGKPTDREDAYRMIQSLQGHSHEVMTGVTVLRAEGGQETAESYTCVTAVDVAAMEDEEIRRYLATGEADDKAGAYGIQGAFSIYVTGIQGSYSNVVGLPVAALYQSLKRLGWRD